MGILDVAAQTQEKKLVKIMGSIDKLSFMRPTYQSFVRKWRGIVFSQWINNELFANKNLSRVDIQRCLHGNSIASSYVSSQNGQSCPSVSSAPNSPNSHVGSSVIGLPPHAAAYNNNNKISNISIKDHNHSKFIVQLCT